jgi:hypothetical protein
MKSGPYAFHVWMKIDPHPPAEQVLDVKSTAYGLVISSRLLVTRNTSAPPLPLTIKKEH